MRHSPRGPGAGMPYITARRPDRAASMNEGYRLCQTTRIAPVSSSASASMRSFPPRIR